MEAIFETFIIGAAVGGIYALILSLKSIRKFFGLYDESKEDISLSSISSELKGERTREQMNENRKKNISDRELAVQRERNFIKEEVAKSKARDERASNNKEDKLKKLKDLYDKELISKEVYEKQQLEILSE
tara:strand:+ start:446 stop:838 length:393 start_codon:yes stop_codon:yes gene_type:complete